MQRTGVLCLSSPGMQTLFSLLDMFKGNCVSVKLWIIQIQVMCLCVISHVYTFVFCCSETFSFMLTGEDGSRRFGYCRRLLVSPPRTAWTPHPPDPFAPCSHPAEPCLFLQTFFIWTHEMLVLWRPAFPLRVLHDRPLWQQEIKTQT